MKADRFTTYVIISVHKKTLETWMRARGFWGCKKEVSPTPISHEKKFLWKR